MLPSNTTPETYGPPLEDYDEVVDPETEISATKLEALAVDVAACTYVVPRAWASVQVGSPATVSAHNAVWGSATAVKPTVAKVATGIHKVTWPTSTRNLNPTYDRQVSTVTDARSASVSIQTTGVTASTAYVAYTSAVELTAANEITVLTGDGSAFADLDFTVWMY